jgi:DNA-binding LacI/PurR family transcriptional regulator
MARLLALPEPPDAVFCFNDTMALGALHVLSTRRLRVPEDVAVIGFDNVPMAEFAAPPLTTIEPGTAQIAKQAVDLLAARVTGDAGPPTEVFTDCSLVVRHSA